MATATATAAPQPTVPRVPPREMTRLPPMHHRSLPRLVVASWWYIVQYTVHACLINLWTCFLLWTVRVCVVQGRGGVAVAAGSDDGLAVTEQQVAKLMEEDMGTAMQYLQGKGLCLMPVSLASAISSATCHMRPPVGGPGLGVAAAHHMAAMRLPPHAMNGGAGADAVPASPSMSVLTAQSAMAPNGAGGGADGEGSHSQQQPKDAASVSKP
jgi:hypothetical protein